MTGHAMSTLQPLTRAVDRLREARWITRRTLLIGGYLFAALSVFLIVSGIRFVTRNGVATSVGDPLAFDFLNMFAGAKAVYGGHAQLVYDHAWFDALERTIVGPQANVAIYSYPPVMLLLTLPLAFFSYVPALIVWTLLGVGLGFALLRRLVAWPEAAIAVIGTPGAFYSLLFGQNGFFTAAFLAGGLMALERRPVIGGICFGCLAYKPHLGLLLPVALAVGGHWRTFAAAAATVAVLVLASLAFFGTSTWIGFLGSLASNRDLIAFAPRPDRIPTAFTAARELGMTVTFAYAVQMLSSVLALGAIVFVWRTPAPVETKAASLVVATFLVTPYAWDYDTVVLIFAAAWLGREGMRTGFLPWERIAIVLLLTFVLLADGSAKLWGIQPGPVILWLVLLVLMRRALGSQGRGVFSAPPI